MEKKTVNRIGVILYAVCAVLWTVRAILEVIYKTYNDSVFLFVLNILCAVVWILAFVVNLKRYRSGKEK